jgi:hypothetical protein
MNLKEEIALLMSKQTSPTLIKNPQHKKEAVSTLSKLGIPQNSEFFEFFSNYYGSDLTRRCGASPLVDPAPPQKYLLHAAFVGHDAWEVPEQYILFSTGEGEGGYLYNKEDGTVWDYYVGKQELLGTDALPHWNSFYEFMVWYLTDDE